MGEVAMPWHVPVGLRTADEVSGCARTFRINKRTHLDTPVRHAPVLARGRRRRVAVRGARGRLRVVVVVRGRRGSGRLGGLVRAVGRGVLRRRVGGRAGGRRDALVVAAVAGLGGRARRDQASWCDERQCKQSKGGALHLSETRPSVKRVWVGTSDGAQEKWRGQEAVYALLARGERGGESVG